MGRKRVTMRDIAQACGVSVATVSHALNHSAKESVSDALRLRIIQTATKMHYSPAATRFKADVTAGIIINIKSQNTAGKLMLYRDLAAQIARQLRRHGHYAVQFETENLAEVYKSEALHKLDAWFFIDVDDEAFEERQEGFYGPILMVDGDVENPLYCKVQANYTALYEKANAMLQSRTAFLAIEDVKSVRMLKKMVSPFAPSNVFVNRPGARLDTFLQNQRGKKGIVLGDMLGQQVQRAFPPEDVVVVGMLETDELLWPGAPCLHMRNSDKARAAVAAMQAMLRYEYISDGSNHILLESTED